MVSAAPGINRLDDGDGAPEIAGRERRFGLDQAAVEALGVDGAAGLANGHELAQPGDRLVDPVGVLGCGRGTDDGVGGLGKARKEPVDGRHAGGCERREPREGTFDL